MTKEALGWTLFSNTQILELSQQGYYPAFAYKPFPDSCSRGSPLSFLQTAMKTLLYWMKGCSTDVCLMTSKRLYLRQVNRLNLEKLLYKWAKFLSFSLFSIIYIPVKSLAEQVDNWDFMWSDAQPRTRSQPCNWVAPSLTWHYSGLGFGVEESIKWLSAPPAIYLLTLDQQLG